MTEKLRNILDSYEDFELANLSRYKLNSYMDKTYLEIKNYIQERGLTETKINELIKSAHQITYSDNHVRCPRCKSNKIRSENIEWSNTSSSDTATILDGLNGGATYRIRQICNICEYYISDPNNESLTSKSTIRKLIEHFLEIFGHH
jgi:hypothetical protein